MARLYVVMCKDHTDNGKVVELPLSGTVHVVRFNAFLEMEHAKDNPQYAGETFYLKEIKSIKEVEE